jgi:hypothetical protein
VAGEGMETTFTGDPAALPASIAPEVNFYDPNTKTFVLNAFYNATPRIAYEIMTRK